MATSTMFEHVPLTVHEAFSGIAGSISLACWIFLLVPQLIENYRQSSADGISITFLLVWMAGDITNLAGALWADLVPTVIALAIYFCFADAVLLSQCFYYNTLNARRERKRSIAAAENAVTDENAPLLAEQENLGLPGSRRRSSAASRRRTRSSAERSNSLTNILEEGQGSTAWLKNTLSVAIILIAGAAGWAIAWRAGAWKPTPVDVSDGGRHMPVGAEVLGYASAVCYLGARIPQIIKNHRERSCEGLSLLFFLLSLMGNLTYGAGFQILLHSVEKQYFLKNLPWLIGSLGTIFEDAVIFMQFHMYGEKTSAIE
ncbi:vacuolar membrane PQ loop repeat protein [Aureobasidium pullulans]|nr:vacuolar membrane PQ loop repeat protein [Aureobasidium pullulans]THY25182.1 vacuolar membrane PQ loop repeat protein [Aureobasidium pullulans]THY60418.1 vacuolar membrane PQ loop repeat protein [Aureobasidium pullulans]THY63524.1 vacuolar membrane PQ loop repeat protein [Aureobasidium pullulans]THZ48180.1 vacuolar membrane PQ loop repeat protein [Aureobasidium pullulans]